MRVKVLGVGFDNITREEAVSEALALLDSGGTHYVVTPNPEIVEVCRESEEVAWAVNGADLVLPDGIGVIKGAQMLGTPLRERVPGIEFANGLLAELARTGHSLYLLGGKPGVAAQAATNLMRTYPGLRCVGFRDGYFRDDEPVVAEIQRSGADVVFVCLGAPKQELWMLQNGPGTGAKLLCGLGGSLDVFAGVTQRAPEFFCKHGLEWFYRLCKEPWRWKRMLKLPLFLIHVRQEKRERRKLPPERPALEVLAEKLFPDEEEDAPPTNGEAMTEAEAVTEAPPTHDETLTEALPAITETFSEAPPTHDETLTEALPAITETFSQAPPEDDGEIPQAGAVTEESRPGEAEISADAEIFETTANQENAAPVSEGRSTEESMSDFEHQDTTNWDPTQIRRGQEPESPPPRRRRRKNGMGWLRVVAYLFVVVVISVILASVAWELASDLCAFNRGAVTTHTVQIAPGDTVEAVSEKLHDAGLVKYPFFFRLFADVTHAEKKISSGAFTLTTDMDYRALVVGMRSSAALDTSTVKVTIPEGYTVRDICRLLAEKGVASEEDLLNSARYTYFDYGFINNDSEDISRLEGYLYPDTYDFYMPENPDRALHRLLTNFARKIDAWQDNLGEAEERGYTLKQIVTIASLIEKETDGTDQARIASVIYNRLSGSGSRAGTYGLLQIDASVLYGIPNHTGPITSADLESSSPYNLYKNAGLPPTAIANPGAQSLLAAMSPEESDYYYYALTKDGKHRFFTNYSEFSRFLASSDYIGN